MSDVIDLFTKTPRPSGDGTPPGPPPFVPPEGLSQDDYEFYIYGPDKELVCHERRGHLVVTGANIVLFNPEQEMIWGIPNNDTLAWFEKVVPEIQFELPLEE